MSTLIACDNSPATSWLADAYRAGFDAELLVLLDQADAELGRLRRG